MTYRWKATEFPVLTRRQVDKYHNPARQDLDNYFMTTRHVLTYRHPGMVYGQGSRGQRDPMPECIKHMVRTQHADSVTVSI